jgi:hypothetical protein
MDCFLDHLGHFGYARQRGCRWPSTRVYSYLNLLAIFVTLEVGYILLSNIIFCVFRTILGYFVHGNGVSFQHINFNLSLIPRK